MHDLNEYLDIMCSKIRSAEARANARAEIESHLLDEIDALVARGMGETQAVDLVLSNATDPKVLGKKLNLAHRPFILRYPLTLAFGTLSLGSVAAVIIACQYILHEHLIPLTKQISEMDGEFKQKFEEDLQILSRLKLPYMNARSKNAHSYLVQYVGMDEASASPLVAAQQEVDTEFERKKGWKSKASLISIMKDPRFQRNDTSWVEKSLEFDHWNFLVDPSIKEKFAEVEFKSGLDKIGARASFKFPQMGIFQKAVIYHTLKLVQQGQHQKAQALIDHAFILVRSTNMLVGDAIAASIMAKKRTISCFFNLNWNTLSPREYLALRRIPWGWSQVFTQTLFDSSALDQFKQYARPELGMCAGFTESVTGLYDMKEYLWDRLPFETDHRAQLEDSKLRSLAYQKICDVEEFAPLLSDASPGARPLFGKGLWHFVSDLYNLESPALNDLPLINPSYLPYVRRVYALHLYTLVSPNFGSIYRRPSAELLVNYEVPPKD